MLVPQGTPSAEDSLVVAKVHTKQPPPNKIKKKVETNHKKSGKTSKKAARTSEKQKRNEQKPQLRAN